MLIGILIAAAVFRFINLSWDGGHNFHPDEALVVNGAAAIRFFSNLNPGFHDYNGLPVYLLRLVAPLSSSIADMTYLGRILTAALSAATVFIVFLIGKRLWGYSVGILAAALLAPLPLAVQQAHFYTSDTFVTFFLSLLALAVVNWWQVPSRKNLLLCALWVGLAVACKNTAYLLLFMPAMAVAFHKGVVREKIIQLLVLGIGAAIAFALASPYSIIDWPGYMERARYLGLVVAGKIQFDWTVQFLGTTPLFWVKNSLYAFGPAVAIIGFAATWFVAFRQQGIKRILALWTIMFIILLAGVYLKFIRYLLPLAPMFVLFAAAFIHDVHKRWPVSGKIVGISALAITWIWGVMFAGIYTVPHPVVQAADWIVSNVPAGAKLVREEGNELLRFSHAPLNAKTYNVSLIRPYALPDTQEKADAIRTQIAQADYVFIESNKVRNTVTRLNNYYPYTSDAYKQLEDGELGYELVAEFSSRLDLGAEETFWVFDHPRVRVYKKED